MNLFISFLVLALSLFSINPILFAYRLPNRNHKTSDPKSEFPLLTANSNTFEAGSASPSRAKTEQISYLNGLMSQQKLYGIWQGLDNMQEKSSGNQEGFSSLNYLSGAKSDEDAFDYRLCFYNGLYTNTNFTCVTYSQFIPFIQDNNFDEQNATLKFTEVTVHLQEGKTSSINQLGVDCVANTTIYFLDKRDNSAFTPSYDLEADIDNLAVQFVVQSADYSINIMTTEMTSEDTLNDQAMDYSVAMTVAAVFQGLLCLFLDKTLQEKKNLCQRVSLGTLRIINAFDFYLAIEGFFQFANNVVVGFMALPYIVLSFYCETKIIRTIAVAQGNLSERGFTSLSTVNLICLIFSMVTAAISAFFHKPELMFFLFILHPVPQIVQNYKMQRKFTKNEAILSVFTLPKLLYIAYVLTVPRNLFRYTPDLDIAIVLINVFALQIIMLLIQKKYPTFYPGKGSAYKTFPISERKHKEETCSICLESPETCAEGNDKCLLKSEDKTNKMLVLTPCQHQFHECCLRDWVKLKCVCPYCRAPLPLFQDEDD